MFEEIKKILSEHSVPLRGKNRVPPRTYLERHQYFTLLGILNLNRVLHIVTTVPCKLNSTWALYMGSDYTSWLRLNVRSCPNFFVIMYWCMTRGQDPRVLPTLIYPIVSVYWTMI